MKKEDAVVQSIVYFESARWFNQNIFTCSSGMVVYQTRISSNWIHPRFRGHTMKLHPLNGSFHADVFHDLSDISYAQLRAQKTFTATFWPRPQTVRETTVCAVSTCTVGLFFLRNCASPARPAVDFGGNGIFVVRNNAILHVHSCWSPTTATAKCWTAPTRPDAPHAEHAARAAGALEDHEELRGFCKPLVAREWCDCIIFDGCLSNAHGGGCLLFGFLFGSSSLVQAFATNFCDVTEISLYVIVDIQNLQISCLSLHG